MGQIKRRKMGLILVIMLSLSLLALTSGTSLAIPTLQLDIAGGTYDSATQTIIASGDPFTLYAYLNPQGAQGNIPLNYTFYLSAALVSPTGNPDAAFNISSNFFNPVYNGTSNTGINTVNFAAGGAQYVDYGNPPHQDYNQGYDSGDLPLHKGIFPTYFKEFKVVFDADHTIAAYDTAARAKAGTGIDLTSAPGMYYASLTVNTLSLPAGDAIHFDLYTVKSTGYGDLDVYPGWFAPFAYDAQSLDPPAPVPEPSTIMLLGSGLVGLGFWGRRRFKARS